MNATIDTLGARIRETIDVRFADSWRPLPTPEEYARRTNETLKTPVRLSFVRARVDDRAELRLTTIDGPGTEIFALMIFPDAPSRTPVFAAEYVVFGKCVRAAVADLQPAGMDASRRAALEAAMAPLAARHPDLLASEELPAWCRDYFTPSAVFALRREADELPRLEATLDAYLEKWRELATPAEPERVAALAEYKIHHVVHTPGRPYLERMFGAEWTESFLRNAMYA